MTMDITPIPNSTFENESLTLNTQGISITPVTEDITEIPIMEPVGNTPRRQHTSHTVDIGESMLDQAMLKQLRETPKEMQNDPILDTTVPVDTGITKITVDKSNQKTNMVNIPSTPQLDTFDDIDEIIAFENLKKEQPLSETKEEIVDTSTTPTQELKQEKPTMNDNHVNTNTQVPDTTPSKNTVESIVNTTVTEPTVEPKPTVDAHTEQITNVPPVNRESVTLQSTPVRVAPVTKPMAQSDDDETLLDVHSSANEPTKPVEVDILEGLVEPFDPTRRDTIRTNLPYTEILIPNIDEDADQNMLDRISPNGEYYLQSDTYTEEEKNNITAKIIDPTSIEYRMLRSKMFNSDKQAVESEALSRAVDHNHVVTPAISIGGKTFRDKRAGESQLKALSSGDIVDGKDSFPLAMALIGGIRKVHLYNSGFWVVVRPPLLYELHTYYLRCKENTQEYGTIFGQLAYLPADVEIRQAGIDLFKTCIVQSNLVDYKIDDVFERNLSFLDYDTCLWAMASLMFPTGTSIEYVCVNKGCRKIDRQTIDLGKIRYFDMTRLGEDAIKYCYSDQKRTSEDITHYKQSILKDSETVVLNDNWTATIGVPSFYEEQKDGRNFVAEMATMIQLDSLTDVDEYLSSRYFRTLAPWINRITYTKLDDGKKVHFEDPSKLPEIITALQLIDVPLPTKIKDVMENNKISYYCYSYDSCPVCHHVPKVAVSGLIPCDMQQSFFSHTKELLR